MNDVITFDSGNINNCYWLLWASVVTVIMMRASPLVIAINKPSDTRTKKFINSLIR